jgi:hypothetical protein
LYTKLLFGVKFRGRNRCKLPEDYIVSYVIREGLGMLLVGKHKTGSVFPSAYQYLIRTSSEK